MKKIILGLFIFPIFQIYSQLPNAEKIHSKLPLGTKVLANISYENDGNNKHLLDLYLPFNMKENVSLVIIIHGGGWISNDKYSDLGYMPNTISKLINNGFAIASIDYRFAQDAPFPSILKDCNQAITYLYDHSGTYQLNRKSFFLMGFSAGGHLASLIGTSQNNEISILNNYNSYRKLKFKGVVDFYGPVDLILLPGNDDEKSPEAILIGGKPLENPLLATSASPITYIDPNDPPFLIFHGEKDQIVSNKQSKLFSAWLKDKKVENELIIVSDAPHFGPMYDVEEISEKILAFLIKNK